MSLYIDIIIYLYTHTINKIGIYFFFSIPNKDFTNVDSSKIIPCSVKYVLNIIPFCYHLLIKLNNIIIIRLLAQIICTLPWLPGGP